MEPTRLQQVRGEFVGYSGDQEEECYVCKKCGKPKLYVNSRTGAWICFVCNLSGTSSPRIISLKRRPTNDHERAANAVQKLDVLRTTMDQTPECEYRRVLREQVCSARQLPEWLPSYSDFVIGFGIIAVPLQLNGECVGYHSYQPVADKRYTTHGRRGLWAPSYYAKTMFSSRAVLLFEGLFDLLSAESLFRDEAVATTSGHAPLPILTCGNSLSADQFTSLTSFLGDHKVHSIWLCFDNDQLRPLAKTHQELAAHYCKTFILPPPRIQEVKDWDDYAHIAPIDARKDLRRALTF